MSRMPSQKIGIDTPMSANTIEMPSIAVFLRTAESTPRATPTSPAMRMATTASLDGRGGNGS